MHCSRQGRALAALVCVAWIAVRAEERGPLEKPLASRIADRSFPSVFQAWNPADNLKEDGNATRARHDLIFHSAEFFGLRWDKTPQGLATGFTTESVRAARQQRCDLLRRNPNLVLIAEIRYRDAHRSYLPDGHAWWRRDSQGKIVAGWEEGGYLQLDFGRAAFREQVALQAQAAVASGVVDGIMLDWWQDDEERLALIKAIRARIGERALVLANANDRRTPMTAPFINGYFMECCRSQTAEDWSRIADTLVWAESHLRSPRVNCLETWFHTSRADENLMRCVTTLSLTQSDGYCLFSDPNPLPTPDHLHTWYPFWERRLGRPLAAGHPRSDGTLEREFTCGTAICNLTNAQPVAVAFGEPRTSRATGRRARAHMVGVRDGDLFLKDGAGASD